MKRKPVVDHQTFADDLPFVGVEIGPSESPIGEAGRQPAPR